MNKVTMKIWDRIFVLKVDYDCFRGEELLQIQKDAIQQFVGSEEKISASLPEVKEYCLKQNADDIGSEDIENIFKYVLPKSLYAKREDDKRVVALMCDYKFDMEHGLAVIFENEKVKAIGAQDIAL